MAGRNGACCCGQCVSVTYPLAGLSGWTWQAGSSFFDDYAILLRTDLPPWTHNFSISVESTGSGGFSTDGNGLRVFFGWQDSSNYWYATTIFHGGIPPVTVKLVQVVAGSEVTKIEELCRWHQRPHWWICYQNGILTLADRRAPAENSEWYSIAATIARGRIGIGSTVDTIHVAEVEYIYNTGMEKICDECLNGLCCEGYALPESVSIVIAGLPAPYDAWNGGYVIPKSSFIHETSCIWRKANALSTIPVADFISQSNTITVSRVRTVGVLRAQVLIEYQQLTGGGLGGPVLTIITLGSSPHPTLSGPWTVSPCHDQWSTPFNLVGGDGSTPIVGGFVDEITGNF
jgi:hypothetical protein